MTLQGKKLFSSLRNLKGGGGLSNQKRRMAFRGVTVFDH